MRNERYNECKLFVKELHSKQVDKGGNPYYHHLYEVANNAKVIYEKLNITDSNFIYDCMEIGLLHDSVEDCNLSFDVICQKYGDEVANGVKLLTKVDNTQADNTINGLFNGTYIAYLSNLYQAYLDKHAFAIKAIIVKLSDLKSNLNYKRLGVTNINELNNKQLNHLLKYHTAYRLLESVIFDNKIMTIDEFKQHLISALLIDEIDVDALNNSIDEILK